MKREIKFRGKRLGSGDWLYGDLTHDGMGEPMIQFLICDPWHVDPATIGQYTGLKDKNGAEIYEGDILTMDSWNPNIVEVCFDDGAFCLKQENIPYMSDIHYVHHAGQPQASIIGNIHDNPTDQRT